MVVTTQPFRGCAAGSSNTFLGERRRRVPGREPQEITESDQQADYPKGREYFDRPQWLRIPTLTRRQPGASPSSKVRVLPSHEVDRVIFTKHDVVADEEATFTVCL